jgi:capsular polysaccharide biosynthesis protein
LDFWDLGKLLGRRWRISVPMLLLSIALTAVIFTHVKPDYVATAYVQLVPPVPVQVEPGKPERAQRNPWLNEDLKTLASAAVVSVQDIGYIQSLKDTGYSDSFTAAVGDTTPLMTFEVTGKSAAQASGTADQLVDQFNKSLSSLQTSYGVTSVDLITSTRLDGGTNVVASSSNVKRSVAAVAVVGLLLAIAVTITADAWLRRRGRSKSAAAAAPPSVAAPPLLSSLFDPPPAATETIPLVMTRLFRASASSNGTPVRAAPERASSQPGSAETIVNGNRAVPYDAPPDATVILPRTIPAVDE